ncbi:MAG: PEP-CTERM sorting domain-containing protein, partial [Planctomycetota bacterium]
TFTVEYIGLLEEGGGSPFIKYEEYNWDSDPLGLGDDPNPDDADYVGFGEFLFYANIIPEYEGPYDILGSKADQTTQDGTLTGAYPKCEIVPEPATIFLLAFGGIFITRRTRP